MPRKAEFLSELETRDLDDNTAQLKVDLRFYSEILGREIVVKADFVTDFASVPRLPFIYLLYGNTSRRPAVIHDWLYQTHDCKDRAEADKVFLEAMEAKGVPAWRRRDMYLGVRIGGYFSWRSGPKRFRQLNPTLSLPAA